MVVAVLSIAGDQLPAIPFVEVIGKAESADPTQIVGTAANVGTVNWLTVMVNEVAFAFCPTVG